MIALGYTHYWEHDELPPQLMAEIARDARIIVGSVRRQGIGISGWDGSGQPDLTDTEIRLNGQGPHLDHETFHLSAEATDFAFCKTAMKPYDLAVTAILARARDLALLDGIRFELSSDGGPAGYSAGRELNDVLFGVSA